MKTERVAWRGLVLEAIVLTATVLTTMTGCASAPNGVQPTPTLQTQPIPIAPPAPAASPSAAAPAAIAPVETPVASFSPASNSPASNSPASQAAPPKLNKNTFQADPDRPNYFTDYRFDVPLPATGKVTIRADIASFSAPLVTDCPTDTTLYAFAESTNYRVQICSQEYDPSVPKYYIGRDRTGGSELRLINENVNEARQLIFNNGDYSYTLYRDGARPEQMNAYLEVRSASDGKTYAEALLYLYEKNYRP
jgi:hypothetical protein